MTTLLLIATPLLPLILATLPGRTAALEPWAVLLSAAVALLTGLAIPAGTTITLEAVMLGTSLGLTLVTGPVLLTSALIWGLAGWFEMDNPIRTNRRRFHTFLLLAMAGNFLLVLSQDAVSFFLGYALMGLAAAPLVGHRNNRFARMAMIVYLGFTLVGESLLLAALVHMAAGAGDLALATLASRADATAVTLLLLAFGIKLAAPGVHVWIAMTYRATPTPGAAVLSGAMMNAGILGLLLFLPLGREGFEGIAQLMIGMGLIAAFYGVAVGLWQKHPKAILGYSSMSQMGLVSIALGIGLFHASPTAGEAVTILILLFTIHHGLIKSTLFLLAGNRRVNRLRLILIGLLGLALAGLPLTSGWWVKAELKLLAQTADDLGTETLEILSALLIFTGLTTTLLISRLIDRLRMPSMMTALPAPRSAQSAGAVAVITVLLLPVWLVQTGLTPPGLEAAWVIPAGILLYVGGQTTLRRSRWSSSRFRCRPGDIGWPLFSLIRRGIHRVTHARLIPERAHAPSPPKSATAAEVTGKPTGNPFEKALLKWPNAGLSLMGVLMLLAASLWVG